MGRSEEALGVACRSAKFGGRRCPRRLPPIEVGKLSGPPSRAEVRGWSEMGATYPIIWGKLCTYFEKDVEESTPSAWENLSLDFKGKLGTAQWRNFSAQFLTLMRRTPGAANHECL